MCLKIRSWNNGERTIMKKSENISFVDNMLRIFDTSLYLNLGPQTKDFTSLVNYLELLIKEIKLTREVSEEVKKEVKEEQKFMEEATKQLKVRSKPFEKELSSMKNKGVELLFFSLPNKLGRKFFELMKQLERAGKISFEDSSKRATIDIIIHELEGYLDEIKGINQPFIPTPIDKNQTITLKVKFKHRQGTWRKLEMKTSQTLVSLHNLIQKALDWDNDHLYSFYMDNNFKSRDEDMEYTCPYEPEGRKTADVPIGIFGLKEGQKFAYLFDFGDCHQFEIEVISYGVVEDNKKYPTLLESKGKVPEQYPEYME